MKRTKRKASLILVTTMIFLMLFTGCGTKQEQAQSNVASPTTAGENDSQAAQQPENSWEIDKSPVTLKLFYDKTGTTVDFEKYWGQDPVSKKWIEDTGVNIEFSYPPDNEHSKLNVMIASEDLPDMVYTDENLSQVRDLAKYDQIWALNELAEEYAPNFMDNIPGHVLLKKRVTWETMNLYMAPFYFYREESLDSPYIAKNLMGIAVIDKIYEELGSPKLQTADDFLDLLRTVKEKYPDMIPAQGNRNSSKDNDGNPRLVYKTLPMAGLGGRFYKEGDQYYKYWQHPNFLKLLKFYNALYNEGLIDKTEFTDKPEQLQAKEFSGRVFADLSQDVDNLDWFNSELHKAKPDWNFIMIDAPGIDGDTAYGNDSFNGGVADANGILVSKNSEHADRVIRFLDYLYSDEVQKSILFGIEGQSYTMEGDLPLMIPEVNEFYEQNMNEAKLKYGADAYWLFRIGDYAAIKRLTSCSELQRENYPVVSKYYQDNTFYGGAESYAPNSDEIKIAINIKEYYSVQIMKIILAQPEEVEGLYNEMITQMKELGLEKLNAHWDEYFKNKEATIQKYSADLN